MTALTRVAAAARAVGGTAGPLAFNIPGGMNIDVRTQALAAGWDGVSAVTATVTANIGSTSIGSPALIVAGSFPGSVSLIINSGVYVVGKGGSSPGGRVTESGGPALSVSTSVNVTNNGTIGGGGGAGAYNNRNGAQGGGGAGLNPGLGVLGNAGLTTGGNSSGVAGGAPGTNGGNATNSIGGGSGGGLGGTGGSCDGYYDTRRTDANVGDSDPEGSAGYTDGGAAGAAVLGMSFVFWQVVGTRYGALNS